eukprot:gene12567-13854_t
MASARNKGECCRQKEALKTNPQSNSFFQSFKSTANILEQDTLEVVLSMVDDQENTVEQSDGPNDNRPKSGQNGVDKDRQVFVEQDRRVFRELQPSELNEDEDETFHKRIHTWTTELIALPKITNEKIHEYLVLDKVKSEDNLNRGAVKHKIAGYQLFKEQYVKGVKCKPNVTAYVVLFIVKCFVVASMKKGRYTVYIHLCQRNGNIRYAKCSCKADAGGSCKDVAAVLYQLVEYRQLCLKCVPDDKTCTDVLQKWHVPGEATNDQPVMFSDLKFIKEDIRKDIIGSRKRTVVAGNREFCATPMFAHEAPEKNYKNLVTVYIRLGKALFLLTS